MVTLLLESGPQQILPDGGHDAGVGYDQGAFDSLVGDFHPPEAVEPNPVHHDLFGNVVEGVAPPYDAEAAAEATENVRLLVGAVLVGVSTRLQKSDVGFAQDVRQDAQRFADAWHMQMGQFEQRWTMMEQDRLQRETEKKEEEERKKKTRGNLTLAA